MSQKWIKQKEAFEQGLNYIQNRKTGKVKSLKTPWNSFNKATLDGIEWQSMTVIGGRPGSGKTAIKDQLIREIFKLNVGTPMSVLEFSLEMVGKVSAVRAFSSVLEKSYKYLCSADNNTLTNEELEFCKNYALDTLKNPIHIVEEAPYVEEFREIIEEYMETNMILKDNKKIYQNTVITLDHSLLLKCAKGQNRNDMLYALGEILTALKRKYPIIFIILSQLNRSIDNPERNENGKYGNYVLESDIFGADALLQHADKEQ